MNRFSFFHLFFLLLSGTSIAAPPALLQGTWRGVLTTQEQELPFNFLVEKKGNYDFDIYIHNGDEKLHVPNVRLKGDSVYIEMPIFDSEIRAVNKGKTLEGVYVKNHPALGYTLPFKATHGVLYRFAPTTKIPATNFSGKWNVTFLGRDGKPAQAVGLFQQQDTHLTGTFMTPTGDYRFLEGHVDGNMIRLSTFNGSFAYMFEATLLPTGTLKGEFFAGKTGYQRWTAERDEKATLPDANTLTTLKPGYETLDFTFPGLDGKPVSSKDARFKNKVVVVQLLGTWCPNCIDETAFLAPWYVANRRKGVEVVGLAYEYSPEFAKAKARVDKLIARYKVEYPILIAGTADKGAPAKTLPALSNVNAFPTTIIIDKKGKVRKIHTGFSGPSTGEYYTQYLAEFEKTIADLLKE